MYSLEKLGAVRDWIDIPDRTTRAYALSASVIQEILGLDWFTKNLGTNATEPFFHMNKIEQDPETTIDRGIAVGEMLLNLQGIEGFDEAIRRFRQSHSPEGPFCEFEVGKLMFLMGYVFRFVKATGTKTNDYDMDLLVSSDAYVPIEAKCKVEATNLSDSTIIDTLKKAQKQLPEDKKSFIFMKVPQSWIMEQDRQNKEKLGLIETATKRFFVNTTRVVSVKLYANVVIKGNVMVESGFRLKEFYNPSPECAGNWQLMDHTRQEKTNPAWVSFLEFVGGTDGWPDKTD